MNTQSTKYLADPKTDQAFAAKVSVALGKLISEVPGSQEAMAQTPAARGKALAEKAAVKTALVSAGLAIVPGPVGILSIIPALMQIWKIQRQMVADIAACYGKTRLLGPNMMLYCLFRHGSATVFKETVVQVGGRLLIRQASLQSIQHLIQRLSLNVTQRIISQFFSRFVPLVGSATLGAFTYWDTRRIARTAIEAFEKDAIVEVEAISI